MSAHVLLNLVKLGKSDKMQGLQSILSHFRNEFNKFNNAHKYVRFYLSYYVKIILQSRFHVKTSRLHQFRGNKIFFFWYTLITKDM